ncbi:MAG: manganese efflux pump [Clostridia bacterium]|nr:manganese efflux pump [Clostridia bacterium]
MGTLAAFLVNSILLGVGLAMDAFSVSLANGLNAPKMSRGMRIAIPVTFAAFQFLMPLIGWFCVRKIAEAFKAFQPVIPWIALVLLLFIGGKMLIEGIRDNKNKAGDENEETGAVLKPGTLMVQGVATSIDALSVGFTIEEYGFLKALSACLIIGGVTLVICILGLFLGRRFGTKLAGKASILGGIILIAIGIEIFVTGLIGG